MHTIKMYQTQLATSQTKTPTSKHCKITSLLTHPNQSGRPGAKDLEKYSNTLQLLWLINDYNYITITGPVEM